MRDRFSAYRVNIDDGIRRAIDDDKKRTRVLMLFISIAFGVVAVIMTVLNIFTQKGALTWSTAIFAVVSLTVFVLLYRNLISLRISEGIFAIAFFVLFIFFIITGNPDGFSILWISLLPSCGMLVFGRKRGSTYSLVMFAVIVFLFWTAPGRSLLQYDYSDTFMMRFPFFYAATFAVGFILETVRAVTHKELFDVREKYMYMYSHDALTKVYNRYGFNTVMDEMLSLKMGSFSFLIVDIDEFKKINDRLGHLQGDTVLETVAKLISDAAKGGCVSRWGGEEFAVMAANIGDTAAYAESIRSEIAKTDIIMSTGSVRITVSIGAVTADLSKNISAAKIVNSADACLYRAKELGRNRVESCSIGEYGEFCIVPIKGGKTE